MGQTLSSPITEKFNEAGENENIKYSVSAIQGWRTSMEDSHYCKLGISEEHPDWNYFAIFDGHAGATASKYCSEMLLNKIMKVHADLMLNPVKISDETEFYGVADYLPSGIYNLAVAVHDAFIQLDDDMRDDPKFLNNPITCGTTALALIVTTEYIIFANCGDSRAIFGRDGKLTFQTKDHKPKDPAEKKRIVDAGGNVCIDRVNGNLAVSRAIGDYSFKTNRSLPSTKQCVSPEPYITLLPREDKDQFAVLACDGIWDVMSSNEVYDLVLGRLKVTKNLTAISDCVIDASLYLDSRDNMTTLIVCFPGAPIVDQCLVLDEEQVEKKIEENIEKILSEDAKDIGAFSIVKKLNDINDFGNVPVHYKVGFVVDILNKYSPDRDKSKDFLLPGGFRSFPQTLQILQTVATQYGFGTNPNSEDS